MRNWLAYDILDERATMETFLALALAILFLISASSITTFAYLQEATVITALAVWDGLVLAGFVLAALNICVEVNELMTNDAKMLQHINRVVVEELADIGAGHVGVQLGYADKNELRGVRDILSEKIVSIKELDEPQKIFGFTIDTTLRKTVLSGLAFAALSTILQWVKTATTPLQEPLLNQTSISS